MLKTIKEAAINEIEHYGLFASILIFTAIIILIICLFINIFLPDFATCTIKVIMGSVGGYLFSVGVINPLKKTKGKRK